MKFGEQLERESVPEWNLRMIHSSSLAKLHYINQLSLYADNLKCNSLKHEIKLHTTRDQATAKKHASVKAKIG
jgi:hypothetical protein